MGKSWRVVNGYARKKCVCKRMSVVSVLQQRSNSVAMRHTSTALPVVAIKSRVCREWVACGHYVLSTEEAKRNYNVHTVW